MDNESIILQQTNNLQTLAVDFIKQHTIAQNTVRQQLTAVVNQLIIIIAVSLCQCFRQRRHIWIFQAHQRIKIFRKLFALRWITHDMQAGSHLHILQIRQICVQMADIFIKISSILLTHLIHKVSSSGLLPDLCHRLTQIGILISLKVHIFLQSLFQLRQLIIYTANTQRCRKIADKAGSTAAFGLYALTRIDNPIGINIGQITGADIRIAFVAHRHALARKPFQTAMRTDVHHRICTPDIAQPMIKA